eukprot:COSAG02_NODE_50037_length_323_cov_0.687500_1_plen_38_part_01
MWPIQRVASCPSVGMMGPQKQLLGSKLEGTTLRAVVRW